MSDEQPGLSRAMRDLWGRGDSGRRGPKPALSVRAIADVGVALADAEGLEAVTMAAVAQRLGFTTMSLYRYVESRQDLLLAMIDQALGPPPELPRRRAWRGQVEAWARAEVGQLFEHPWVLDAHAGTPPIGPNSLAWMEAGFAALMRSGLEPGPAAESLLIVDGYVRSSVQLALRYGAPEASERWVTQLRAVLDPDHFPAIHAVLGSGAFEDDSVSGVPSKQFDFGLALVLDGIQRLVGA